MKLSVVIPAYNEAGNIRPMITELLSAVSRVPDIKDVQVIVIDDHSTDETYDTVRAINDKRVLCIRLSRRSGSHTALRAGIQESTGDAVLCISADGQDDPAVIAEMMAKRKSGAAVVWALRKDRAIEPWHVRGPAMAFYRILFWLAGTECQDIDFSKADFFLLDRRVVQAINACGERNTSLFGLIVWVGFNQASVEYDRRHRSSGLSKWRFTSRFRLAKDWVIAFSGVPIKIASLMGIIMSVLGALGVAYVIIDKLFFSYIITGWTTIVVLILILSGVQLTILGIMGEYLWRNLDESRKRPLFFIEERTDSEKGTNG